MKELNNALDKKIQQTLNEVAKDVKKLIKESLDRYYGEYIPVLYDRTDQLRNSCVVDKVSKKGNKFSVKIYLDIDSLSYDTPGASAYKTAIAADSGLHGGWNPSNMTSGQVPFSAISGHDGGAFGSGTQIWKNPMDLLFGGQLVEMFKKCAEKRGLHIT